MPRTYPLLLFRGGHDSLPDEQPVVVKELEVLLRILFRLLQEELNDAVGEHPAQLAETNTTSSQLEID